MSWNDKGKFNVFLPLEVCKRQYCKCINPYQWIENKFLSLETSWGAKILNLLFKSKNSCNEKNIYMKIYKVKTFCLHIICSAFDKADILDFLHKCLQTQLIWNLKEKWMCISLMWKDQSGFWAWITRHVRNSKRKWPNLLTALKLASLQRQPYPLDYSFN